MKPSPVEPPHIRRAREWLGDEDRQITEDSSENPDGPGDVYHPFSAVRAEEVPPEMWITRKTFDHIATTSETPGMSRASKEAAWIGAVAGAIFLLERELVALKKGGN